MDATELPFTLGDRVIQRTNLEVYHGVVVAITSRERQLGMRDQGLHVSPKGRNYDMTILREDPDHGRDRLMEIKVKGEEMGMYAPPWTKAAEPRLPAHEVLALRVAYGEQQAALEQRELDKKAQHEAEKEALKKQFPHLSTEEPSRGTLAAQNIRTHLKALYPGIKASVKQGSGSSIAIDVVWEGKFPPKEVDDAVERFQYGSFDGMDDSYTYHHDAFTETFGGAKWVNSGPRRDVLHDRNSSELPPLPDYTAKDGEGMKVLETSHEQWHRYQDGDGWSVTKLLVEEHGARFGVYLPFRLEEDNSLTPLHPIGIGYDIDETTAKHALGAYERHREEERLRWEESYQARQDERYAELPYEEALTYWYQTEAYGTTYQADWKDHHEEIYERVQRRRLEAWDRHATTGVLSDAVITERVRAAGLHIVQHHFRGTIEKGIAGYVPPDVLEIPEGPVEETKARIWRQGWERTAYEAQYGFGWEALNERAQTFSVERTAPGIFKVTDSRGGSEAYKGLTNDIDDMRRYAAASAMLIEKAQVLERDQNLTCPPHLVPQLSSLYQRTVGHPGSEELPAVGAMVDAIVQAQVAESASMSDRTQAWETLREALETQYQATMQAQDEHAPAPRPKPDKQLEMF